MATVLTYEYDSTNQVYIVTGATEIADDGLLSIPKTYNDNTNGEHQVTTIKENAFNRTKSSATEAFQSLMDKIKKIYLSKNISKLELGAFANSISLTEVDSDAEGEMIIDRSAFYYCSDLTKVTLPKTTFIDTYTGSGADQGGHQFSSCSALTSVVFNGPALTQPKTFSGCSNLTIEFKNGSDYGPMGPYYPYGAVESSLTVKSSNELLKTDMDFLGFTFNGLHSYLDLKAIRTSDGDRYNVNLTPETTDLTAENPSADGMYYFNSYHKTKKFNLNFAFERLTDVNIRSWKQLCANKKLGDLIFDEEPYKVYTAKITGQPSLKFIPFDESSNSGTTRVYRGEGNIEFTCYWPYAHTPDKDTKVSEKILPEGKFGMDGKNIGSYGMFNNKSLWAAGSGLTSSTRACTGENPGDLPAPFILSKSGTTNANTTFTITDKLYIKTLTTVYGLKWDSKTGVVSGLSSALAAESTRAPVPVEGNTVGGIPVGGCSPTINGATLTYHYWYY